MALLPLCTTKQRSLQWGFSEQQLLEAQKLGFDLLFMRCKGSSASSLGAFIVSFSLFFYSSPHVSKVPFYPSSLPPAYSFLKPCCNLHVEAGALPHHALPGLWQELVYLCPCLFGALLLHSSHEHNFKGFRQFGGTSSAAGHVCML